jgi:hypothetical protein
LSSSESIDPLPETFAERQLGIAEFRGYDRRQCRTLELGVSTAGVPPFQASSTKAVRSAIQSSTGQENKPRKISVGEMHREFPQS